MTDLGQRRLAGRCHASGRRHRAGIGIQREVADVPDETVEADDGRYWTRRMTRDGQSSLREPAPAKALAWTAGLDETGRRSGQICPAQGVGPAGRQHSEGRRRRGPSARRDPDSIPLPAILTRCVSPHRFDGVPEFVGSERVNLKRSGIVNRLSSVAPENHEPDPMGYAGCTTDLGST